MAKNNLIPLFITFVGFSDLPVSEKRNKKNQVLPSDGWMEMSVNTITLERKLRSISCFHFWPWKNPIEFEPDRIFQYNLELLFLHIIVLEAKTLHLSTLSYYQSLAVTDI